MTIGARIKEVRGNLSQKAAALKCGIKQPVWNRYEKDESSPASESIVKICTTFGCSADWLLGLTGHTSSTSVHAGEGSAVVIGNGNASVTTSKQASGESPKCTNCPIKKKLAKLEALIAK